MRHFYVHDGGVTIVASDGKVHEYPVDILKAFASKFLQDWGQRSGDGLEALRRARAVSGGFPAIASCQRFGRVLAAANSIADTTMVGLREDLEFYALNINDCARLMEEIDMDAAEVLEMMESIARRGDSGLVANEARSQAQRQAAQEVGDDVAAARDQSDQQPVEQTSPGAEDDYAGGTDAAVQPSG